MSCASAHFELRYCAKPATTLERGLLPSYALRLGFTRTVDVPHDGVLGFAILELMLQSRASLAADVAGQGPDGFAPRSTSPASSSCATPRATW